MTRPLSPAAEAVLFAFLNGYVAKWNGTSCGGCRSGLAAALRAAATALKPDDGQSHQVGGIISARLQLLAIANELDPRP